MSAEGFDLAGKPLPIFDGPVRAVHGPSPLRRPGSVRRTSTLDVVWPTGASGLAEIRGTGRDLLTPREGDLNVLAESAIKASADGRTICAVASTPPCSNLAMLRGVRAGGRLRAAIDEALPGERASGSLLYTLLDDLAGTTLVAGWSFSRWTGTSRPLEAETKARVMSDICIGFRSGSGALTLDGSARPHPNCTPVLPIVNAADPCGWHLLVEPEGVHFRRARRTDVWRMATGELCVDAGFQDSASLPDGGRVSVHEYRMDARVDPDRRLASIRATPGTLPFAECRAAPVNLTTLIGTPMADLRDEVIVRLRATAGCTHLNDMLRTLAEVPVLAAALG